MKHFCLLELAHDSESPMIGVVINITDNPNGFDSFRERITKALEEYFDAEVVSTGDDFHALENIFGGGPYEDIEIKLKDDFGERKTINRHKIRILETWIY